MSKYPAQYRKLVKDIKALHRKWWPLMDLPHMTCDLVFTVVDNDNKIASASVLWKYREATITWFLPTAANCTPQELESTTVHELCHVLNDPVKDRLKDESDEQLELATENMARALLRVHRG